MYWYLKVIKNYCNFKGRASRTEYWMFFLSNFFVELALVGIMLAIGNKSAILGNIYSVFMFVPSLALLVRRMHDVNKSGWFVLKLLSPGIVAMFLALLVDFMPALKSDITNLIFGGAMIVAVVLYIWLFILTVKAGDIGDNAFGQDPQIEVQQRKNA